MTTQVPGYKTYDKPVSAIETTPALVFGDSEYDYQDGQTPFSYLVTTQVQLVVQANDRKQGAALLRDLLQRSNLPNAIEEAMPGHYVVNASAPFEPTDLAGGTFLAVNLQVVTRKSS